MSGIEKPKVGETAAGLTVYSNANDAVTEQSQMTSLDCFDTNVVDIYDNESGQYLNLTEEELSDPSVIQQYAEDADRYAILLGSSKEDADGFMNMEDFIENVDYGAPVEPTATPTSNDENQSPAPVGFISKEMLEGMSRLEGDLSGMKTGEMYESELNGKKILIKKYEDGTVIIGLDDEDGSKIWYRYAEDENGNKLLIEVENAKGERMFVCDGQVVNSPHYALLPRNEDGTVPFSLNVDRELNGQPYTDPRAGTTYMPYPDDDSTVVCYTGEDGTKELFKYDANNNLTEVRQRIPGSHVDILRSFEDGRETSAHVVTIGGSAPTSTISSPNNYTPNTTGGNVSTPASGPGSYGGTISSPNNSTPNAGTF